VEGSLQHIINSTMLLMIAATFFSGKPVLNAPKFTLVRIIFVKNCLNCIITASSISPRWRRTNA
jgi:hypothetical protein